MKFNTKMFTKGIVVLTGLICMQAQSFAGNTIGDVPMSANENRTIKATTSLYTGSCDIAQELAFYENSPVYLRIAQPKGPVSYVFDKTETYVIVYNLNVLWNIKFPYISNFVPSTTLDTSASNILTVDATGGVFSWWAITTPRNQPASEVVTKNNERSIIQSTNWANLNYYYRRSSDLSLHNGNIKISINPNLTQKTACTKYYVAKCGDGVIDKATWTSDGNWWIQTQWGNFLPWHTRSIKPNEVCDDGPLNGQPGKCKKDCSGYEWSTPNAPTCTLSLGTWTIQAWESTTLQASYSNGINATLSPSITTMPAFTYPNWQGSTTVSPTTTTTYTLTVEGTWGTSPATCSQTLTVIPPAETLQCTLKLLPAIAGTGDIVNLQWNVNNGNFFGTYIYVTPQLQGWWPYPVNANQYSGSTTLSASTTGIYTFTMMVHNNLENASCTGTLHVIDPSPTCTLTTTTPNISQWQSGVLQISYNNTILATINPGIFVYLRLPSTSQTPISLPIPLWLFFSYPSRSNTNVVVHPTQTTTYTMHVLWVHNTQSTCSTTIHVQNTGLFLSKNVVTNIEYQPGDIVTFKINFANLNTVPINNVVITDYLPGALEYISSQIVWVAPYTFWTGIGWGQLYVQYSGFSLAPWQSGYILLAWRFKGYQYANQTLNNAFAKGDDTSIVYASALFNVKTPTAQVTVTKTTPFASYYPWTRVPFTITITNHGPDSINNILITDLWPNQNTCITLDPQRSATAPLTVVSAQYPYSRLYSGSLWAQQSIALYLTGNISNSPSCVGTYTNNAYATYVLNATTHTWYASWVSFEVSTTPSSYMLFEKRIVSYGTTPGDLVTFELLYQNQGNATISSFDIIDYWPGSLDFVAASPMPNTQTQTSWWRELRRHFPNPLGPYGSGKIILQGKIK